MTMAGLHIRGIALFHNHTPKVAVIGAVACVVGFAVMMALWGWHPTPKRALPTDKPAALEVAPASAAPLSFLMLKVNA
jgi:hypothetical protein